jgi:RNA polymerase sigma-70 factor, ECF subfamily
VVALLRHMADLCPAGRDAQVHLLSVNYAEDLYLACACAQGIAPALAEFERRYLTKVASFLPARDATPTLVTELTQVLRERLFVAEAGTAPRITGYSGKGSLLSWVRTTAVRTAINLGRGRQALPLDEMSDREIYPAARGADPELEYLKGRYREDFKGAFHAALQTLAPELRNVMRLHYVEGVGLDRISAMFQVHRTTANRWVIDAREKLQRETRNILRRRLGLSPEEFESLAGLVRSQIELSLARELGGEEPSGP